MTQIKTAHDLEVGDMLEVWDKRRRITEIDKDREVPEKWREWCDAVWTVHFDDDSAFTVFPDDCFEVYL